MKHRHDQCVQPRREDDPRADEKPDIPGRAPSGDEGGAQQCGGAEPDPEALVVAFKEAGAEVDVYEGGVLEVAGLSAEEAGDLAFASGVPIHELTVETPDLEHIFLDLAGS